MADSLLACMAASLKPAAEPLTALDSDLQMRVKFGRLTIEYKKAGTRDHLSYADLARALGDYSKRGGAKLMTKRATQTRLFFVSLPATDLGADRSKVKTPRCSWITSWRQVPGPAPNPGRVRRQCSWTIADVSDLESNTSRLSAPRLVCPEEWTRLAWTMLAPDM